VGKKGKLRIIISIVCIVLFIIGYWIFYTGCCLPCIPIGDYEYVPESSDQTQEQINIEKPGEHQTTEGGEGLNVNPEDIEGDESQQGNPGGGGGGGGGGSGGGGC